MGKYGIPTHGRAAGSPGAARRTNPSRRTDASDADGNAATDRARSAETASYRGSTPQLPLSLSGLRTVRRGERPDGPDLPPTSQDPVIRPQDHLELEWPLSASWRPACRL